MTAVVMTSEERNEMLSLMSDLSKQAYGFRVRKDYTGISDEEVQSDWDYYLKVAEQRDLEEAQEEARCWEEFKQDMQRIAEGSNVSVGTALRWDMDAYDVNVTGSTDYDVGYYCYKRGLAYGTQKTLEALLEDNCSLL